MIWGILAVAALLWPGHVSGPLHGIPLDGTLDALAVGIVVPLLWALDRQFLATRRARALILLLIAWKLASAFVFVQDGFCVRVLPLRPYTRNASGAPHSWDVRADWRMANPTCSAIMTHSYHSLPEFPVWFFNLPPPDDNLPAAEDRPPAARVTMTAQGFVSLSKAADLDITASPDVMATLYVDGTPTNRARLAPGTHAVVIDASMTGDQWALIPRINGEDLWSSTAPTIRRPSAIDVQLRRWVVWIPVLLTGVLVLLWVGAVFRTFRLSDARGALLIAGVPWLAYVAIHSAPLAGRLALYPAGDDFWQFQRYAYRIVMQGYWLEGGSPTFWFQPLYRWTAGVLHLVFGDSRIGESIWDGWSVLIGAIAAFHLARLSSGFWWGIAASILTLITFQFSNAHTWLGVGLGEISAAGLLYLAVIITVTHRTSAAAALAAGLFATLGFYTRLNHVVMALGIAALCLPPTVEAWQVWRPSRWLTRVSWRPILVIIASIAIGILLLAWRTWHYTGVFSVFYGTQKDVLATVQPSLPWAANIQRMLGSVMMVLTINDPARVEPIALPLLGGAAVALMSLAGIPRLRSIPLALAAFGLMSVAGALAARGAAYTGRFSVHAIPAMCALSVCGCSALLRRTQNTE